MCGAVGGSIAQSDGPMLTPPVAIIEKYPPNPVAMRRPPVCACANHEGIGTQPRITHLYVAGPMRQAPMAVPLPVVVIECAGAKRRALRNAAVPVVAAAAAVRPVQAAALFVPPEAARLLDEHPPRLE